MSRRKPKSSWAVIREPRVVWCRVTYMEAFWLVCFAFILGWGLGHARILFRVIGSIYGCDFNYN